MARDEEEGQDVSERMNKDEDAQKPKWRTDKAIEKEITRRNLNTRCRQRKEVNSGSLWCDYHYTSMVEVITRHASKKLHRGTNGLVARRGVCGRPGLLVGEDEGSFCFGFRSLAIDLCTFEFQTSLREVDGRRPHSIIL